MGAVKLKKKDLNILVGMFVLAKNSLDLGHTEDYYEWQKQICQKVFDSEHYEQLRKSGVFEKPLERKKGL